MNKELLARCYTSCLELAEQHGLQHIAFVALRQVYSAFHKKKLAIS